MSSRFAQVAILARAERSEDLSTVAVFTVDALKRGFKNSSSNNNNNRTSDLQRRKTKQRLSKAGALLESLSFAEDVEGREFRSRRSGPQALETKGRQRD